MRLALACFVLLSSTAFAQDRGHHHRRRQPPPPPPRDCGTGVDPGCELTRGGGPLPLDAGGFSGLLAALDSTPHEYDRLDRLESIVESNALTAAQLGPVLDRFSFEYIRLDAAKVCAPKLVDPGNAYRFAAGFNFPSIGSDYTRLIAEQG